MKINFLNITVDISYTLIAGLCIALILSNNTVIAAAVVSSVLHEAAHIAVMRRFSSGHITVRADLFNIVINDTVRWSGSYRRDTAVLCAGPEVNMIIWAISFCVYKITSVNAFFEISMVNASLAVFNLLPIETTDGGQLLGIILRDRFNTALAERIVFFLSLIIIIPAAVIGFYILIRSKYNYTMLLAVIYLAAAILSKI